MASQTLKEYKSSSSDKVWKVSMDSEGVIWCDCKGWRFHARRWCKHLEDYQQHLSNAGVKCIKEQVIAGTSVDQVTEEVIKELQGLFNWRK
jgi:hypothetical protein